MNNLHFKHWRCRIRRAAGGVTGVPPIHFGKEDSVERTLLMGACQSETFLAPPWQGGISIRVLWHIGCQSEFDKGTFVHRNGHLAGREALKYRFIR